MVGASSAAHFNNREEGTPSGPAAEVEESSCIESIIICSVISISVRHSSRFKDWHEKKETGWVMDNHICNRGGENTVELIK